jgi:hypothetical protein
LPVGSDWIPAVAKSFLVGIAVLRNDSGDPLGVADGEPEARRSAVVKDIDREAAEADNLCEALDHARDVVECVAEFFSRRHVELTEPGKVRRDDMESVGEQRDQVTEHMAGAREAVEE